MTYTLQHKADILQDRFGVKLAARLSASADELPYDISERLRAARMQAMGKRKLAAAQSAPVTLSSGGAAVLGFGDEGWNLWSKLASALPLIALAVGLVAINVVQDDNGASEVAEVDVAILTDNLPPSAYTDPGFLQFLRVGAEVPRPSSAE